MFEEAPAWDPKNVGVGIVVAAGSSFYFSELFLLSNVGKVFAYFSIAVFSIANTVSFKTLGHAKLA